MTINLTETAAKEISKIVDQEQLDVGKIRLRVGVKGGGCSGFSYGLAFDERTADDDRVEDHAGVSIVIDAFSAKYVDGAEIDYVDSLMGSGFAINNPNAVSSCSCGHSFNTDGSPSRAGGCAC